MPVTTDIAASYRRPGAVVRGHIDRGISEASVLAFLMGGCLMLYVARWPALRRQAEQTEDPFGSLMTGELIWWILYMPLVLYAVAGLSQLAFRLFKAPITGLGARLSLFWAVLAASPMYLLAGMTNGFIGEGLELDLVRSVGYVVFAWFWYSGLRAVRAIERTA